MTSDSDRPRATAAVAYDGVDFKRMLSAAAERLASSAADIDALNVFPVPDGDTGTNMLLTLRSTLGEMSRCTNSELSAIVQAMARGSLMGARGNSGVILSQILRGLAAGLDGKKTFTGKEIAAGLEEAVKLAYKSMSRPVEGTMLTVVREMAAAAQRACSANPAGLIPILEAAVEAARDSVARTPALLPILRQACVVDAGGQGLYVILEGMLLFVRGDVWDATIKPRVISPSVACEGPRAISSVAPREEEAEKPYGYCTEMLIAGQGLHPEEIRGKLEDKGESLIVVGDEKTVKVHIHTYDPGLVLQLGTGLGTLHDILIRNMDDQHQEYLEKRRTAQLQIVQPVAEAPSPLVPFAVVAVASGEGLRRVFQSLGATAVVPGGPTMNPSIEDLLRAVEAVASDKVILLPNNKNIIPAARQLEPLTTKKVVVAPTETIPQGVAALIAVNPELDVDANRQAMEAARASVRTIALTRAVRSSQYRNLQIDEGQAIGLIDDELAAAGRDLVDALGETLGLLDTARAEAVTMYYGENVPETEVQAIESSLRAHMPGAQIEVVDGGQPYYPFIISVE